MPESLEGMDEIVHDPDDAFAEQSNVYEFMQKHGISDFEELHRRSANDVEGIEASGLDWFWDDSFGFPGRSRGVQQHRLLLGGE